MWRLRIWKPVRTPPAGASPASSADSPLSPAFCVLRRGSRALATESGRLVSVWPSDLGLRLRGKEADVDAVGRMLVAGLSKDRSEIGGRSGKAGLKQGAVERGGVGDEEAQVAGSEAGRELDGDANIALGLMPGAEGCFDFDGVAGVSDIGGDRRACSSVT